MLIDPVSNLSWRHVFSLGLFKTIEEFHKGKNWKEIQSPLLHTKAKMWPPDTSGDMGQSPDLTQLLLEEH